MSAKTTEAVTMRPYKIIVTIQPDEGNEVKEPDYRIGVRTTGHAEYTQMILRALCNSLLRHCEGDRVTDLLTAREIEFAVTKHINPPQNKSENSSCNSK